MNTNLRRAVGALAILSGAIQVIVGILPTPVLFPGLLVLCGVITLLAGLYTIYGDY